MAVSVWYGGRLGADVGGPDSRGRARVETETQRETRGRRGRGVRASGRIAIWTEGEEALPKRIDYCLPTADRSVEAGDLDW